MLLGVRRIGKLTSAPSLGCGRGVSVGWLSTLPIALFALCLTGCAPSSEQSSRGQPGQGKLGDGGFGCVSEPLRFGYGLSNNSDFVWLPVDDDASLFDRDGAHFVDIPWLGEASCAERYSQAASSLSRVGRRTSETPQQLKDPDAVVDAFSAYSFNWRDFRRLRLSRGHGAQTMASELSAQGNRATITKRENPNHAAMSCGGKQGAALGGAFFCCLARTWVLPIPFPEPVEKPGGGVEVKGTFSLTELEDIDAFLSSSSGFRFKHWTRGTPSSAPYLKTGDGISREAMADLIGVDPNSGKPLSVSTVEGWFAPSKKHGVTKVHAVRRLAQLSYLRLKLFHYVSTGSVTVLDRGLQAKGLNTGTSQPSLEASKAERAGLARSILDSMLSYTFDENNEAYDPSGRPVSVSHAEAGWYAPENRWQVSQRWEQAFARFVRGQSVDDAPPRPVQYGATRAEDGFRLGFPRELTLHHVDQVLALRALYEGMDWEDFEL